MKRLISTANFARLSALHPWRTIGLWVMTLVIAIGLTGTLLDDALSTDVTTLTNNPESAQGDALMRDRLGEENTTFGEIVVVRSSDLTVDDPAYRAFVAELTQELADLGNEVIVGVSDYWGSGDETLVSDDRHTTLVPLVMPVGASESIDQVHAIAEEAASNGAFTVLVTGEATLDLEITEVAEKDLAAGESIGIALALIVLAIVFGAVVAAILPIALALVAIVVALGATSVLGQFLDLPVIVINVMTMLGLAVGIDYSLFVVSRYREERTAGRDKIAAITAAGATAGRTVLISGLTVAVALAGLIIMPDTSNQAIGAGAVIIVAVAVLSSMTLLPAMLSLLGDRVNRLRIAMPRRLVRNDWAASTGFWDRSTRLVLRRPLVTFVLAAGVLLAAPGFVVDMRQGEVAIDALPDGLMSKDAYLLLEEEFGFGQDLPAIVVIDGQIDAEPVIAGIAHLQTAVAANDAFAISTVESHPEINLSIIRIWLNGDATSNDAMQAVTQLREDLIPVAFASSDARVLVTGKTATIVDLTDVSSTYTPIVFLFVLGFSFMLLMVAFRSIVVPVKAIAMNLLSVGAAYGMLVLVFQKGFGADLFGFQQVDVIQTGLPLFLFAVLFGLSMDYHVFLISRIRERYLETGDNDEAVAYGLRTTGRLITGAALIMVAVFGGFALGDLVPMQQMGFGLAIAVLIDATIIRCLLVPAGMRLMGDWNWYLPGFLNWLPEVRLEAAAPVEVSMAGD